MCGRPSQHREAEGYWASCRMLWSRYNPNSRGVAYWFFTQYPMPPLTSVPHHAQPKQACFQCKHFLGLVARGSDCGRCGYPGGEHVRTRPENGCAFWALHPHRSPDIKTAAEWEAAHGRPIRCFDDDLHLGKWPSALHARRIKELYKSAPGPESRALAWEIARLQDVLYRAYRAIKSQAEEMPHTPARANLLRLTELLAQEPGVKEAIAKAAGRRSF